MTFEEETRKWLLDHFGLKTINQIREENTLPHVKGGDRVYADWYCEIAAIPWKQRLTVVPNLAQANESRGSDETA